MEGGNTLIDLLDDLADSASIEQAWSATTDFMRSFGIDIVHSWYGFDPQTVRFMTARPAWWISHYMAENYIEWDHVVHHCIRRLTPIVYGSDVDLDNPNIHPMAKKAVSEANEALGLRNGVVYPVRSGRGQLSGGINLGSSEPISEMRKIHREARHVLHIAALTAHARVQELLATERTTSVRLSPREQECLLWLTRGERTGRIAERLGLQEVTITLHLGNARRKLSARTREQAVARALALGLICP